jgi:hypothetical protein
MSALTQNGTGVTAVQALPTQSFSLILSFEPDDDQVDRLYEACADATLGVRSGVPYAAFDREAATLAEAIQSAIRDVESTVPDLKVVRIEPDDLVNAMEISRRVHKSREVVRLWIAGERGGGEFPPPAVAAGKSYLWRWIDVASWLAKRDSQPRSPAKVRDAEPSGLAESLSDAALIAAMNSALELRKVAPLVQDKKAREVVKVFISEGEEALSV